MEYNFESFNRSDPFRLLLTGAELEKLIELFDRELINETLPPELGAVVSDMHSFLTTFYKKEDAEGK